MPRHAFLLILLCGWTIAVSKADAQPAVTDRLLFDFEDPGVLKDWSNMELPGAKVKEPAAKIERSAENATSGKHSLKITFAGGNWPTVITRNVTHDWMPWHTLRADVTVSRPCVVGFCVMQEGSTRGTGWDGGVSRWAKTAFLKPGKNSITADLHPNAWSAIRPKLENGKVMGKVVSLEIFMYRHSHPRRRGALPTCACHAVVGRSRIAERDPTMDMYPSPHSRSALLSCGMQIGSYRFNSRRIRC